jgi:hypothetical protein
MRGNNAAFDHRPAKIANEVALLSTLFPERLMLKVHQLRGLLTVFVQQMAIDFTY